MEDPKWRFALRLTGVSAYDLCDYSVSASEHLWFYRCRSTCVGFGSVDKNADCAQNHRRSLRPSDRVAPLPDLFCAGQPNHTTWGTAQQQAGEVSAAVNRPGHVHRECPANHRHSYHPHRSGQPAPPPLTPLGAPPSPSMIKGHVAAVLVILCGAALLGGAVGSFSILLRKRRSGGRAALLSSKVHYGQSSAAADEIELQDARLAGIDANEAANATVAASKVQPPKKPRKPRKDDITIGQVVFYKV